jgi:hypothetical protein
VTERKDRELMPRQRVKLTEIPPGLLDDLPLADQRAISAIVGRPILLTAYDADGRAELKFVDENDIIHFIYVEPRFISRLRKNDERT